MSAPKHTPGPWTVISGGFGPEIIRAGGKDILLLTEGKGANLILAAAAPDLLEAARAAAKSHMMYGKVMQRDIDALINAIHKAQGGDL